MVCIEEEEKVATPMMMLDMLLVDSFPIKSNERKVQDLPLSIIPVVKSLCEESPGLIFQSPANIYGRLLAVVENNEDEANRCTCRAAKSACNVITIGA